MINRTILILVLSPVAALTVIGPAHAYIDPGTGSLILQSIIGAIAAGLVTIKIYWQKIRAFFSSRKQSDEAKS